MPEQDVLDLGRIDVLAAGDQHVLGAVDDRDEAVGVDRGDVAGVQPAVDDRLGGRLGPVPVAEHHVGPRHQDLAVLARIAVGAVLADDAHVGVEERPAGRSGAGERVGAGDQTRGSAGLGESVHLMDLDPHRLVGLDQFERYRRGAAHHPAQPRAVVDVGVVDGEHVLEHHRHHEGDRDVLVLDLLPGIGGIERADDDERNAAVEAAEHRRECSDVEHRQGVEEPVLGLEVRCRHDRQDRPHDGVVGVHHTLGQAGRAARVHDEHQVVIRADRHGFDV